MPVRSLSSRVLRWPNREAVTAAARDWAKEVARKRPEVLRVGYFGSCARGDWGVGSDLDLVVVVESSAVPFERRGVGFDITSLPVPADLLVYTEAEWQALIGQPGFGRRLSREVVWLWQRLQPPSSSNPRSAK